MFSQKKGGDDEKYDDDDDYEVVVVRSSGIGSTLTKYLLYVLILYAIYIYLNNELGSYIKGFNSVFKSTGNVISAATNQVSNVTKILPF
jgi:hypothetical protein